MESILKARGLIVLAILLWLVGYLSAEIPNYSVPFSPPLWSDEIFTEVWYGCDAIAKWLLMYALTTMTLTLDLKTHYICFVAQGWAVGNVCDELFLDPYHIHYSEAIGAVIFALYATYKYLSPKYGIKSY